VGNVSKQKTGLKASFKKMLRVSVTSLKNLNRETRLLGFPTLHNGASGRGEERSCDFRVKKARS
jgi:hypothetical protein